MLQLTTMLPPITYVHLFGRLTGNLSSSATQPSSSPRPPPAMILGSQPSQRLITSPIRAFSWSRSECGTSPIAPVLVGVSWWTLRRCVSFLPPLPHRPWFQEQEAIYGLLFNLQTELMQKLQDGVVARDVYHHAISYIREKKPELEKNFVRSVGFGVRIG